MRFAGKIPLNQDDHEDAHAHGYEDARAHAHGYEDEHDHEHAMLALMEPQPTQVLADRAARTALCFALSLAVQGCDEGGPSAHAGPMLDAGGGGGSGGSDAGSSGTGGRDIAPPNSGTGGHESIACDPHPDDPCLACLVRNCCGTLLFTGASGIVRKDGGPYAETFITYDSFLTCLRGCVQEDADGGSSGWEQLIACGETCQSGFVASDVEAFLACGISGPSCGHLSNTGLGERLLSCALWEPPARSEDVDAGPDGVPAGAGSRGPSCADVCFPNLELSEP